jgi:hypothetical protein
VLCCVVLCRVVSCCVNYVVLAQWLIDLFSTSVTGLTSCNMHLPDYNFFFTPKSNIRHVPLFWFKCNPRSNYIYDATLRHSKSIAFFIRDDLNMAR